MEKHSKLRALVALVVLAAAAVVVTRVRLRLAAMPLERDEGEYAYFGQLLLHGVLPYAAAYSMKFPGIYAAYAAVEAALGQTAEAIRVGLLSVNLATGLFIFFLGRRVAGLDAGGYGAAAFLLMSASASVLGFAAHATHFVALFAAAGAWLLLKAIESGKAGPLFAASGLVLGLAYTMKQHGVVFVAFGAVWLLRSRVRWSYLAIYLAAAAAPFVAIAAVLLVSGLFSRFWFWNFVYASRYVSSGTSALHNLGAQLGLMGSLAGFAALAAGGLFAPHRRFVVHLALFSAAAVVPGLYFRGHYFIQLLPAAALLVGLAAAWIGRRYHFAAGAAVFLAAAGWFVAVERAYLFDRTPLEVCRSIYGGNPFPEAVLIGDYIREHTSEVDRVLVLGSEPEIYFYAQRRGATGYVYMYGLMEDHPYNRRMQEDLIEEAEAAKPEIVVLVRTSTSWLRGPKSPDLVLTWSRTFLSRGYERIGVIEVGDPPKVTWGPEVASLPPRAETSIIVFRKVAAPVMLPP